MDGSVVDDGGRYYSVPGAHLHMLESAVHVQLSAEMSWSSKQHNIVIGISQK